MAASTCFNCGMLPCVRVVRGAPICCIGSGYRIVVVRKAGGLVARVRFSVPRPSAARAGTVTCLRRLRRESKRRRICLRAPRANIRGAVREREVFCEAMGRSKSPRFWDDEGTPTECSEGGYSNLPAQVTSRIEAPQDMFASTTSAHLILYKKVVPRERRGAPSWMEYCLFFATPLLAEHLQKIG